MPFHPTALPRRNSLVARTSVSSWSRPMGAVVVMISLLRPTGGDALVLLVKRSTWSVDLLIRLPCGLDDLLSRRPFASPILVLLLIQLVSSPRSSSRRSVDETRRAIVVSRRSDGTETETETETKLHHALLSSLRLIFKANHGRHPEEKSGSA